MLLLIWHYVARSRSQMLLLLFEILDLRARCATFERLGRHHWRSLPAASVGLEDVCSDPKSLVIILARSMNQSHPFSFSAFNSEASFETGVSGSCSSATGPARTAYACRGMRGVSLNVSPLCNLYNLTLRKNQAIHGVHLQRSKCSLLEIRSDDWTTRRWVVP